jgi:hypothetical protein
LESVCRGNSTVGSNPTLSAISILGFASFTLVFYRVLDTKIIRTSMLDSKRIGGLARYRLNVSIFCLAQTNRRRSDELRGRQGRT